MKRFLNWLADKISPEEATQKIARNRSGTVPRATRRPVAANRTATTRTANSDYVEFDAAVDGRIEAGGPGKNVLRRTKFVREEAGTHDMLSIVDDSSNTAGSNDAEGIDPYNTGRFDRSKNWDKHFRKD